MPNLTLPVAIEPYVPWIVAALLLWVAVRERQGKATPIADTILSILSGRPRQIPTPTESPAMHEVTPAPLTVAMLREALREELGVAKEQRKDE